MEVGQEAPSPDGRFEVKHWGIQGKVKILIHKVTILRI